MGVGEGWRVDGVEVGVGELGMETGAVDAAMLSILLAF